MCVVGDFEKSARSGSIRVLKLVIYKTPLAFIEIILFFKTFFKLGSLKKRANSKIIFISTALKLASNGAISPPSL